jgi:hypothetical protein
MSTRNLSGSKALPARNTDNFTAICESIVYEMWEPRRLTTLQASTACTRNLPGSKALPARRTDNFTAICESIVYEMWEPRRLTTLQASTACYKDTFIFVYILNGIFK